MAEEHSIKNLVSRTANDPWNAVLGRRPGSYQIPEVGRVLIESIDLAVFERQLDRAIVHGVILEKWAENTRHFSCKAPAVMSTVYSISGMNTIAEAKLVQAKNKVGDCLDCNAHYFKRNGIYLLYDEQPTASLQAYTKAMELFELLGDELERAKCLINRGVVKSIMNDAESGLADEEAAMEILDPDAGHYIVICAINRASILTKMGRWNEARQKIEEAQELLAGTRGAERPKIVLRWIRALLLHESGDTKDRKLAGQLLDRVEARMRTLNMGRERRVLLADRARIARAPTTIKQIAQRALAIEDTNRVRARIQTVIEHATPENVMNWRNELDSYVPTFHEMA